MLNARNNTMLNGYAINCDNVCAVDHGALKQCPERRTVLQSTESLNAFLAKIERRAFRIAEYAVGNADDALDVVQEAMIKLADKYAHKPENEWTPLFYRILQSKIMDHFRSRTRRNKHIIANLTSWLGLREAETGIDGVQMLADEDGISQDRVLDSESLGSAMSIALQTLPLRQKQVFMLRAWEGLDVRETARVMKCSEGSVKTHYFRALKQLRSQLGEHVVDAGRGDSL